MTILNQPGNKKRLQSIERERSALHAKIDGILKQSHQLLDQLHSFVELKKQSQIRAQLHKPIQYD